MLDMIRALRAGCQARSSAPLGPVIRFLTILSALLTALAFAGCGGEENPPEGPQTGTIGGLAFSVFSGAVTISDADGSISADASGAFLLFDDTIDALVTTPSKLNAVVTLTLQDGGTVDLFAFGDAADPTGGVPGAGLARAGAVLGYRSYVSDPVTPDVSADFAPQNIAADAVLRLTTDLHSDLVGDTYTWSSVVLWPPEVTVLGTCTGEDYVSYDPTYTAAGNRFGIALRSSTITGAAITDAVDPTCF